MSSLVERQLDVLFVNPNSAKKVYQGLSDRFSAIEPPVWSLLLAESCRKAGFGVEILDCNAEWLNYSQAVSRVLAAKPRLVCMVVYGQNPNSGTTNMVGAKEITDLLAVCKGDIKICYAGSHTQALPLEVLGMSGVDFVLLNEGVYALRNLLATDLVQVQNIGGIGWKPPGIWEFNWSRLNPPKSIVLQDRIEEDLPGYAWDLLPRAEWGGWLDLYRAHNWFPAYGSSKRTPYAAVYTSLGCPFSCQFCMINNLNRDDNSGSWTAADSAKIRYFSTEWTIRQIAWLVGHGVTTIRISDEMFFLNPKHYVPLLETIRSLWGDFLDLWAYARVDTVRSAMLPLFRSAGVKWLALGIESGDKAIRKEVSKGSYEETDVRRIVKEIQDAGIEVIANYIFGLPDDDAGSMEDTLDLSIELNTAGWNGYPCMALPGSPLHKQAKEESWRLPDSFEGYSFHSYECLPLPTKYLTAAEVLMFRDEAFWRYHSRPEYLSMLGRKFGPEAKANVEDLLKTRLRRRLLGD